MLNSVCNLRKHNYLFGVSEKIIMSVIQTFHGQFTSRAASVPAQKFKKLLSKIREAALEDGWEGFFVASVFLSVVRSGRKAELFQVGRLSEDRQAVVFDILSIKGLPGWDSDSLDRLATDLESRWSHKLDWSDWDRLVSGSGGVQLRAF